MTSSSTERAPSTTVQRASRAAARFDSGARTDWQKALDDVIDGARDWQLRWAIAWPDARRRSRPSVIGHFWITISLGILIAVFGFIFGTLFQTKRGDYIPYISLGFIFWQFMQSLINSGCMVFTSQNDLIRQLPGPLSRHVFSLMAKEFIVLAHAIWVFVPVVFIYSVPLGLVSFMVLPGFVLLCINLCWMVLLLGLLSARFRDIPQIVQSATRILFYVTPIIWSPDMFEGRALFLTYNPMHQLLEIVRAPLLGEMPDALAYGYAVGLAVGGWLATLILFSKYRWRVPYWI